DTGIAARIDSVRAVQVAFAITNGRSGADERITQVRRLFRLPNAGLASRRTCGDAPLFGSALTTQLVTLPGGASAVELSWPAGTDETGGEGDVIRYVLWRRVVGAAQWGDPYLSVPAGNASYLYQDAA